jgi:hypothetical protein
VEERKNVTIMEQHDDGFSIQGVLPEAKMPQHQ